MNLEYVWNRRSGAVAIASLFLVLLAFGTVSCGSDKVEATDVVVEVDEDLTVVIPDQRSESDAALDGVSSDSTDVVAKDSQDAAEEDIIAFDYPCDPGAEESCVTACGSAGWHRCLKEWGPCIPPDEFCGNCSDDDCDGAINEGCEVDMGCDPTTPDCPVAIITVQEGTSVFTNTTLHLSAANSTSPNGTVTEWTWTVQAPAGSAAAFSPSNTVESPTLTVDVAGQYLITLEIVDSSGTPGCSATQVAITASPYPPTTPEIGCADGEREGFLDQDTYTLIAGCAGAWSEPGITPDDVGISCNRQGGDDGPKPEGTGCSSWDLCAEGWHVCNTWHEVAAKSPTGCVGSVPPDAKPKSLFFAIRQPSFNGSVCGEWGDGFNDVFGCGNLGAGLGPDKDCGPLDRVLASTQPNSCGFNEAEPNLGPWECLGGSDSHLNEGALATKDGCPNTSCSYDGYPVGSWDKGGVLCCRD